VVRVDLPGHGASSLSTYVATGADIAEVIRAVLQELDLTDVVLAGHSLGGIGALRLAVDDGEAARDRLAALVLVSTSAQPFRLAEVSTIAMGSHPLARPVLAVPALGRAALRATCFAPHAEVDAVEHVRQVWLTTPYRTRWAYAAGGGHEMTLAAGLHRVALPTVAITGAADSRTPVGRARHLAEAIPQARLEVVEGAGHAILVERPDAVADAILSCAALQPVA
jgi:3-oxoadipate enol-lactonase